QHLQPSRLTKKLLCNQSNDSTHLDPPVLYNDNLTLENRLSKLFQPVRTVKQAMPMVQQEVQPADGVDDDCLKKIEDNLTELEQESQSLFQKKMRLMKAEQQRKTEKIEEKPRPKRSDKEMRILEVEKETKRLIKHNEEQKQLIREMEQRQEASKEQAEENDSVSSEESQESNQHDPTIDADEEVAQMMALALGFNQVDSTAEPVWAEWNDKSDDDPMITENPNEVSEFCSDLMNSFGSAFESLKRRGYYDSKDDIDSELIRDYKAMIANKDDLKCLFGIGKCGPNKKLDCPVHTRSGAGFKSGAFCCPGLSEDKKQSAPSAQSDDHKSTFRDAQSSSSRQHQSTARGARYSSSQQHQSTARDAQSSSSHQHQSTARDAQSSSTREHRTEKLQPSICDLPASTPPGQIILLTPPQDQPIPSTPPDQIILSTPPDQIILSTPPQDRPIPSTPPNQLIPPSS
ncbi:hypothetical protein BOX15_Mlig021387g1, partial [Macrostomum lignano]